MAVFDRIKTTTTSTTSPFVVSTTPPTGYLGFSKFSNGATDIPVAIVHQTANEWQVCYCSWNSATNELTVTSVLLSTNADAAVTFSAGTKDVFVTASSRSVGHLREINTWTANNYFNGGNVSIGTVSPNAQFHILSPVLGGTAGNAQRYQRLNSLTSGGSPNALLLDFTARRHTTGTDWLGTNLRVQRTIDATASGFIDFGVDGVSASNGLGFGIGATTYMAMDNSGNVGIGTTGPSSKLTVSDGTVRIDLSPFSGSTGYVGTQSNHPLGIITNNAEAVRVTTDSRVGIGTTNPSGYDAKLAVFNGNFALTTTTNRLYLYYASATNHAFLSTAAGGEITFSNGTASPSEKMRIDTSGRVGIGTTPDPSMLLDVAGPIRSFSSTTNPSLFVVAPNTSAFPGAVVFQSYRTSTTPPQTGDNIGYLDWRNHVYNAPARITVSASETHGATASGANIRFATCANGSATLTDRLYIRHDGCIGVNRIPDAGLAIDAQNVSGDTLVRALATNQRPVFLAEARQDTGYAPAFFTMRRHNANATQTPSSVTIGELRWDGLTTGSAFTTFAGMRADIGANSTTGAGGLLTFSTATGTVTNDLTDRLQLNSRGVLYIVNDLGPDTADTLAVGFRGAPHNDQTGTTYTFARTDAGRAVMFKGTANATWTIPLSTTTDFPIGTMIIVDNSHFGSGTVNVTVQGATGVGIRTTGAGEATTGRANKKQVSRGGVMTLRKLANQSATQSVTSITRVGTTATMTTPAAHGYIVGDFIEVAGAAQSQYNGTQRVLTATSTTLTYAMTADPGASASGTLTVRKADLWNATGNFTNVA